MDNHCHHFKQELPMSSFILHSNANHQTKDGNCQEGCHFFTFNQERNIIWNDDSEEKSNTINVQYHNIGYPPSLIVPKVKTNLCLLDLLTEMYSIYMHLQIQHKIMAELTVPLPLLQLSQQKKYIANIQKGFMQVIYNQSNSKIYFTVYVVSSKNVDQYIKIVFEIIGDAMKSKEDKGNSQTFTFEVSQNEFVVIFNWILHKEQIHTQHLLCQVQELMIAIRCHSQTLQAKVGSIRNKCIIPLCDYSVFYKQLE